MGALALTQELDEPAYGHLFVKKLVARALDKHNHEREMASLLLSALAGEVRVLPAVQCWLPVAVAAASSSYLSLHCEECEMMAPLLLSALAGQVQMCSKSGSAHGSAGFQLPNTEGPLAVADVERLRGHSIGGQRLVTGLCVALLCDGPKGPPGTSVEADQATFAALPCGSLCKPSASRYDLGF